MTERQLSARQHEKRGRILDAALSVFAREGYNAATMEVIALEAQVSKPTLYMYFGSKELLFESMMLAERDVMMQPFAHPSGDMVRDLHEFAWHYAEVVMSPGLLSLARLIIGEAHRFPEIGRVYQQAGPDRLLQGIITYLETQRARGHLAFSDGELAAQDFWALILSAPRNKALHMPDEIPAVPEIKRYIENGLRVFLRAYSTQPSADEKRLENCISPDPEWQGK